VDHCGVFYVFDLWPLITYLMSSNGSYTVNYNVNVYFSAFFEFPE